MKNDIYCCGDYQKPWPPSSEQPVIWRHIRKYTGVHTHTKIVKRVKEEGVGREGRECCVWTENADFMVPL